MVMCFVPTCKHYNARHTCSFFRFPKNIIEHKRWIKLIRRKDKEPAYYSRICSCHFVDKKRENGPTLFDYDISKRFETQGFEQLIFRRKRKEPCDPSNTNPTFLSNGDTADGQHPQFLFVDVGAVVNDENEYYIKHEEKPNTDEHENIYVKEGKKESEIEEPSTNLHDSITKIYSNHQPSASINDWVKTEVKEEIEIEESNLNLM